MLGDHDLGAALIQVRDDVIAVERRVADQRAECDPVDERRHADRVEPLPWQEHEAHEVAERVGEGQDLGGQAAFGAADGLALRPPLAPCPWRWTFTMVASTRAYSRSGSSETASNSRCQTPAFTQSRKRVKTLFQCPTRGGRSRQGLPVRAIHSTASTNRRLFLPLRPGSPGLPRQRGSIFAHWASVKRNLSIQSLNHSQAWMGIPERQQALVLQPGFARCSACSGGAKPCRAGAKPRTGLRSWRRLPGGLPRGSGVRSRADAPWRIFRACLLPWSGRTAGTSPRRPATTRQTACRSSSHAFTGTPMRCGMICAPTWSSIWVTTTRSWCWMRPAFSRRAPSRPESTASTPARRGASRTARSAFSLATPAAMVGR